MTTRPDRYPLHDTSGANSASLPTIYTLVGFPALSVADPLATNALLGSNGDWTEYDDRTLVRAIDVHVATTAYRLSLLNLAYATGAGLGPLNPTTTPIYTYRGAVLRFDSAFTTDAGLRPLSFQASRQTWIYCDANGVVRVETVALATPASPGVTEFVVIGVTTDATDITAIDTSGSPAYQLHYTGPSVFFDVDVKAGSFGAVDGVFQTIVSGGNATTDVSITATSSVGAVSLDVTGNGVQAAATIAGGAGPGLTVSSSSATAAAIAGTQSNAQPALQGTNSGTGDAVKGTSGATTGSGVRGISGNATDAGVTGESDNSASAIAVEGKAQHVDAFAVVGRALAGSSSSARAVLGLGLADAEGVRGRGIDGYGVVAESDSTSPKRAALRLDPQNADPTTPAQGDLRCASERLGKLRHYNGSKHQSLHSSDKGYVFGYATNVDGNSVTTTGDILDVTITAEEVGVVELLVMGALAPAADTTTTTVLFKDITNGVTAFTSQAYAAYDSDGGAAATRLMPFSWRRMYTLVSTTTLFRVRFNFSALVNWYDLTFTVRGVY